MDERRQYKRNNLKYFARVYNRKLERLFGYLVNITHKGMMIVSEKPIDPGAIVALRIELPDSVNSVIYLDIDAQCVWKNLDDESKFYELGFKLRELHSEQKESIDHVISHYGF